MKPESSDRLDAAHKHCFANRDEVMASEQCGCFYCLSIFSPTEITEWLKEYKKEAGSADEAGSTAFCPHCFIDAVIGSRSGYPITQEFLSAMHEHWF